MINYERNDAHMGEEKQAWISGRMDGPKDVFYHCLLVNPREVPKTFREVATAAGRTVLKTPWTPITRCPGGTEVIEPRKHREGALFDYRLTIIRFWSQWESLWYEMGVEYLGSPLRSMKKPLNRRSTPIGEVSDRTTRGEMLYPKIE
jgi:hypothetical protein